MRTRVVLLSVAVSAVGVACGGAASGPEVEATTIPQTTTVLDATTTTEATTTTTAPQTTTTTIDPALVAGDYYMSIVAASNCTLARIVEAEDAIYEEEGFLHEEDWPTVSDTVLPLYAEWAQSLVALIEDIVAYEWPESVEADIERLVGELSEAAGWSHGYSQLRSFDALIEYPPYPDGGGAATAVRARLGLPTNIGLDPDEGC